jgi:uncharacterized protein YciI
MLYAIIGHDVPDSLPLRQKVRPEHLEHIHALLNSGRLIMAGPFPAIDAADPGEAGFSGSLIVAEFPSLADAEAWIQEDPYVTHGIFREVIVRPYKKVFP